MWDLALLWWLEHWWTGRPWTQCWIFLLCTVLTPFLLAAAIDTFLCAYKHDRNFYDSECRVHGYYTAALLLLYLVRLVAEESQGAGSLLLLLDDAKDFVTRRRDTVVQRR